MSRHAFTQVDVFTDTPLHGNPLAVVHGADGLSEARMQAFARWTNLSETTFLLQPTDPGADYRVRIFTPASELRFAGHPTLGSCHAWLQAGGVPRAAGTVVQECGVGQVQLRVEGDEIAFAAPPVRIEPADPMLVSQVLAAIGLSADDLRASAWLDNGARWLGLHLRDAQRVLAARPDFAALGRLADVGLAGAHAPGEATQFELRAFAPSLGVGEDPVTGSLNASMAEWLMASGAALPNYLASQGRCVGRDGRVRIRRDDTALWVGGRSVICIRGDLTL